MTPLRKQFTRADLVLCLAAALGLVLFFTLLPGQHPDAAADYSFGEAGATEAAASFLRANGYVTEGLEAHAEFRRQPDLLRSMQEDIGRPTALASLKSNVAAQLPGYYWRVRWARAPRNEDDQAGRDFIVSLSEQGAVWAFSSTQDGRPAVDRGALASAFLPATPAEGEARVPAALTDSLLAASLSFVENDTLWTQAPAQEAAAFDGGHVLELLDEGRRQGYAMHFDLGPDAAIALARYHLDRSAFGGLDFRVDSVWALRRDANAAAFVRFASGTPLLEQSVRCEVEVGAGGVLQGMVTSFNEARPPRWERRPGPPREASGGPPGLGVSISTESVAEATKYAAYAVLFFVMIFVLFRRINARLIDARLALRDAFWGGFLAAGLVLLVVAPSITRSMANLWIGLSIIGVATLLMGFFGAALVFIVSSATDSLARETWPGKIETLSLVRQGTFYNVPVGAALLRGSILAAVLLGLCTLVLWLFPAARVAFADDDATFLHAQVLSTAGYLYVFSSWYSLVVSLLVLLGLGTLLYRWKPRAALVVPALTLALALVQVGPVDLEPVGYEMACMVLIGFVLALAFWRYDFLTCFVALLFLQVFWGTLPGWMIDGFPEWREAAIVFTSAALVPVVGVAGLFSRRSGAEVPSYVPVYVREVAQREQLKREIEIAHRVQESFLPRRMPRLAGLDVAAMCLAAQEVGGDYFDFVQLSPKRLAVVVGDVSGKGIQAAFYMTLTKGFLQTLARDVASPVEVMRRLNTLFFENARRGTFISMIYGVLDVEARTFTFARAGHTPVILKRSPSQGAELVQPAGMAIGLVTGAPFDETIEEETLNLRPGDVLVFYTDGFSEATNMKKEQYGDERLAHKVGDLGHRSAAEILRVVTEDVHHFVETAGRHDDMTMVVLKLDRRTNHVPAGIAGEPGAEAKPGK